MSKTIITSGKRKRAIARATIKPGTGKVKFNRVLLVNVQPELLRLRLMEPLLLAEKYSEQVDINVIVNGGGATGQIDAARLAIGRGLLEFSKQNEGLKKIYLDYDRQLLVADIRRKEKRKPNCHGKARAKRQKSYR